MNITQAEKIIKLLADIDIDISIEDIKALETIDEIEEYLQDNNSFDVEIIYYYKAMEYLKENDPSLQESMGLAQDMGYEAKDINSELLASLLASETVRNDFYNIKDEIEEILE